MIERLLKNNNIVKIIAFLLALTLWIYVNSNQRTIVQDVTRTITDIPLEYRNLDERLELMDVPSRINIVLRGAEDRVYTILPNDLVVFVNLQGLGEGEHRLTPIAILPRGVRVESFNPQQVTVVLEEVILQQRQVSVAITGEAAEGWAVGEPEAEPDQVFLRGPRSVLDRVAEVRAEVEITGSKSNIITEVPVRAIDLFGRAVDGVVVNPDLVQVVVNIFLPQKDVPVNVPLEGEPAAGYRVTDVKVEPAAVTVTGLENNVQAVNTLRTAAVDVTGVSSNLVLELELVPPEGVELSVTSVKVEIIIEEM
jgi:YbbR domain-containing protein